MGVPREGDHYFDEFVAPPAFPIFPDFVVCPVFPISQNDLIFSNISPYMLRFAEFPRLFCFPGVPTFLSILSNISLYFQYTNWRKIVRVDLA